eukprot:197434_1
MSSCLHVIDVLLDIFKQNKDSHIFCEKDVALSVLKAYLHIVGFALELDSYSWSGLDQIKEIIWLHNLQIGGTVDVNVNNNWKIGTIVNVTEHELQIEREDCIYSISKLDTATKLAKLNTYTSYHNLNLHILCNSARQFNRWIYRDIDYDETHKCAKCWRTCCY